MSGHSKWSTIKHKKGKSDAARGKIFTKIGREIAVAVKEGGADPITNSKLRDAIAKAKANNMPNDTITRSIKKASGAMDSIHYEQIIYEGYGINGVAVILETLTDNKNRAVGEIRHNFDKYGGALGASNCVLFMFDRMGIIIIEKSEDITEDAIMEDAINAGAEDIKNCDDVYEIYTQVQQFSAVREYLEKKNYKILDSQISYFPKNTVEIEKENITKFTKMIETFYDMDDIQNVYHNAKLIEE